EEGSGLKADKDFFVAYSPEREDPGNPEFEAQTIPKVVGAAVPEALEMAKELYATLVPKVIPVSSPEVAEAVKLTENIFRAVNIAMVNELKVIYGEMGIDIWEVIDAAKTKPFGFMPFYPGPGLGGHCIPIDPFYLTWKAREFGLSTRFIELAGQINRDMPLHVVNRLRDALSDRQKKALTGAHVLIVGIAYKKNVDDMRESPSLTLIDLLEERGAKTDYYDPYIPVIPPTREHANLAGRQSIALDPDQLKSYDAVMVATDHDDVDYALIGEHAALVVDTRNAFSRAGLSGQNILKA
ncbi:MAG: nucleotide sugar dehydrogenase, partial [Pseudomonadota bacterium]